MINIHVVKYETTEGNTWEYRTATINADEATTQTIRDNADRQAAETDPALAFVSHDINQPANDAADEPTA